MDWADSSQPVPAFVGDSSASSLALAWAYVGLRVVHSLFQAMVNKIEIRFLLFSISSLVLLVLALKAAWAVLPAI